MKALKALYRSRLQQQQLLIRQMAGDLTDQQAGRRIEAGKWSIQENIAHLGRYHEIFMGRLNRILQQDNPVFARYVHELDSRAFIWFEKPWASLFPDLEKERDLLMAKIESLSDEDWGKTGQHPVLGWMEVGEWLDFFLLHEAHHHYAIFKLKMKGK